MNIQTIIVDILMLLILITALMIVLVGCIGVLRVFIASVFEFDFIKWWNARKTKNKRKEPNKIIYRGEVLKDIGTEQMGYYKGEIDGI